MVYQALPSGGSTAAYSTAGLPEAADACHLLNTQRGSADLPAGATGAESVLLAGHAPACGVVKGPASDSWGRSSIVAPDMLYCAAVAAALAPAAAVVLTGVAPALAVPDGSHTSLLAVAAGPIDQAQSAALAASSQMRQAADSSAARPAAVPGPVPSGHRARQPDRWTPSDRHSDDKAVLESCPLATVAQRGAM